ncbi:MAG: T9SS type A sorting domain-containing protein [Lentimicrobium sp.]|jgi:hypothetical protein|nr:T9SS type A sorting domain-containing protein [Lentimicrobium sp.]
MKATLFGRKIITLLLASLPLFVAGQQAVDWSFNYGGSGSDYLKSIIKSSSGGILAGGISTSSDFDLPSNAGSSDAWVIKVNALGEKEFVTVFGGASEDKFEDALEVDNSYFIMLFTSYSANGDFPTNSGDLDIWLKSITADGQPGGSLHFGGSGTDAAKKLAPATAGGHLIVGQTNSSDGTFSSGLGGKDAFCIRLSSTSQVTWVKKYGSKDDDGFVDALALPDGNLLFCGSKFQSMSTTGWLLKTNSLGDFQDEVNIEKATGVFPVCMIHHAGHIFVAANTNNPISRVTDRHMMIYKFDENLDFVSSNETGGANGSDIILDMKPYDDNHILCLVASNTNSSPFQGNHGAYDLFYVLLTNDFDLVHIIPFGGSSTDGSYENGGSFILDGTMAICASRSFSNDGDLPGNHGSMDGWIFKANPTYSLGTGEKNMSSGLRLYPNPAKDYTEITGIPAGTKVEIFNPGGQRISFQIAGEAGIIDVSNLSSGLYFIKTESSNGTLLNGKLIKH